MSRFQWILISIILGIGLLASVLLLRVESLTPVQSREEQENEKSGSGTEGPHRGVLVGEEQPIQLEVVAEPKGHGKLLLSFYALKIKELIRPEQVQLQANWKRLGQTHTLPLQPQEQAWVSQSLIDEPHSFVLNAKLTIQGKSYDYHWEKYENRLELSKEQLQESKITFAQAGPRTMSDTLELPGKIAANQDRYVHITPRISGNVTHVYKHLGEYVRQGEVLAVLESRELGALRLDYFSANVRYQQARHIYILEHGFFQNTARLIAGLKRGDNIEQLHKQLLDLSIGANRESLVGAYADYHLARQTLAREKQLLTTQATSQAEYQQAEKVLQEARARYESTIEEISRQRRLSLLERQQEMQRVSPERMVARKKLQMMGLTPNSESMSFELRSPLRGRILSQHIAVGEALEATADTFVIADLNEVWAEMMIPESRINAVNLGQRVEVRSQTGQYQGSGIVRHLGTVVDENSRTAEAHAVLPNPNYIWKPGMFVTLQLQSNPYHVPLAVQESAIQTIEGESNVFVQDGEALQAVPVKLGRRGQGWVEVREGLVPGQGYAAQNSFFLKAELEKSNAVESD